MRRSEKEITDRQALDAIIRRAQVCRLAMCRDGQPYVVPLNFGYEAGVLYFHSAPAGRKIDTLRASPRVCFQLDVDNQLVEAEDAGKWTMKYRCVIGFGVATILEDPAAKQAAYAIIMKHYSDRTFTFTPNCVERSVIIKVEIESMTGKQG